ncbi:MAG: hypothetical protein QNK40_15620 [Desulfobacterales bacterium]|nr:hypothetical protein [Desulfobacterales bacterium]
MLSSEKKADFATDIDNLASTHRDINQAMSDQDIKKIKQRLKSMHRAQQIRLNIIVKG